MSKTTTSKAPAAGPVHVERDGRVAWLVLNRPEAANSLSRALVAGLRAALDQLATDAEVSVVVLTGAGGKAFCAGADLKERRGMTLDETRVFLDELGALAQAIEDCPRPVIAAIGGAALGGGFELALAADFRLASEAATLGLTEVRLGIIPGAGGTQRLARLCGLAVAKELVLTGRRIDAPTALRLGLLSGVFPSGRLRAAVTKLAAELGAAGPLALTEAKRAIDRGAGLPLPQALAVERAGYEKVLASEDRNEGLRAFAEERPPRFTGK
jgi:methylglutaconyl-CoA hydratase